VAPEPPLAAAFEIPLPVLAVGDRWKYGYTGTAAAGTFTERVRGRETVDGVECYVIGIGQRRQELFRVHDLAWVEAREDGAATLRHRPPLEAFRWPLTPGLSWRSATTVEKIRDESTFEFSHECHVAAEETVTVPAGTFRTVRINCRSPAGRVFEQWFAPEVRNVVRVHRPRRGDIEKRELLEYQLAAP
jgi:hypothetical protein